MRCRPALAPAIALCLGLGACGHAEPAMPAACVDTDAAGYERALRAAPGAVRLPGGVPISQCLRRVRSDGELQELGAVVHTVAEQLADRVRGGDADAALRLGFLAGAAGAGADRSNGISAELARRVAVAGTGLADGAPALGRALARGQAAGQAHG